MVSIDHVGFEITGYYSIDTISIEIYFAMRTGRREDVSNDRR